MVSTEMRAIKILFKHGIEVLTIIEHARKIDRKNGNYFWRKAIKKETHVAGLAFDIQGKVPHG